MSVPVLAEQKVPAIIFDTDMGSDYDDVGALAVLHALADLGEARILATGTSNLLDTSPLLISILNRYYGRPDLPVGAVKGEGARIQTWHKGLKWTEELPRKYGQGLPDSASVPDVVKVYRKALAAQPDHSVTIVVVGFMTNMRNLMRSRPDSISDLDGMELIRRKTSRLVVMAGKFPSGKETNIIVDAKASQEVFAEWPVPVLISGYEVGRYVRTGDRLIRQNMPNNPVKDAYAMSIPQDRLEEDNSRYEPGGRASYDQTALLAAVRNPELYFGTESGTLTVTEDGTNHWTADGSGRHVRLLTKMPVEELATVIEDLMMQRPGVGKSEK